MCRYTIYSVIVLIVCAGVFLQADPVLENAGIFEIPDSSIADPSEIIDTITPATPSGQSSEVKAQAEAIDTSTEQIGFVDSTVSAASFGKENGPTIVPHRKTGIGLNFGLRLFYPVELNEILEELWSRMPQDSGFGTALALGIPFRVKVLIAPVPGFGIMPFVQALVAGSELTSYDPDSLTELAGMYEIIAGVDIFMKFAPYRRVSFKLGGGFFGEWARIEFMGDLGDMRLSGNGFGAQLICGLDINFNRVMINIDFSIPMFASMDLTQESGDLIYNDDSYRSNDISIPTRTSFWGIEIKPGVTFRF
jgi:hypothetical protein